MLPSQYDGQMYLFQGSENCVSAVWTTQFVPNANFSSDTVSIYHYSPLSGSLILYVIPDQEVPYSVAEYLIQYNNAIYGSSLSMC